MWNLLMFIFHDFLLDLRDFNGIVHVRCLPKYSWTTSYKCDSERGRGKDEKGGRTDTAHSFTISNEELRYDG